MTFSRLEIRASLVYLVFVVPFQNNMISFRKNGIDNLLLNQMNNLMITLNIFLKHR